MYAIVTSRKDVAVSAKGALSRIESWVVSLEPEHYGDGERKQIFASMVKELARPYQRIAQRAESEVLSSLGTPLEIRKFFDALALSEPDEPEPSLIRSAIGKAHTDTIEAHVADQIEQRQQIRAATAVWALLKVSDFVPFTFISRVEDALYARYKEPSTSVMSLVRFLIAGHSLKLANHGERLSYYHPKVEAGIERTLVDESNRLVARETLSGISSFLASDDGQDAVWTTEAAARLVAAARKIDALAFDPDEATKRLIDCWLTDHFPKDEWHFQEHLKLAAECGSAEIAIAEMGRYLLDWHKESLRSGFNSIHAPPERSDQWFARWSQDSSVRADYQALYRRGSPL